MHEKDVVRIALMYDNEYTAEIFILLLYTTGSSNTL